MTLLSSQDDGTATVDDTVAEEDEVVSTPLVVEDGTGLDNADSYIDMAFVDEYFAERVTHTFATEWSEKTVSQKSSLLRIATETLDLNYNFKGERKTEGQALSFPFDGMESIPLNVKKAVVEMVARVSAGTSQDEGAEPQVIKEKFDAVEFTYSSPTPDKVVIPKKSIVDKLMKEFIVGGSGFMIVDICH